MNDQQADELNRLLSGFAEANRQRTVISMSQPNVESSYQEQIDRCIESIHNFCDALVTEK